MVTDIEQPSLFDYASLDGDTRVFVQEKAQAIHARLKRTAEDIIAIGQDLMAVKEKLPDMKFSAWLRSEFGMTRSMAYNFINVSKRFPNGCPNFGQVSVSVLYELAAPSTPDAVIEMVETKRIPPTLSAIREVKRELQQENLPPQQSLEEVVPSFAQWQQDNVDLGLDRWADPLPVVAPHERPFYEVQREIKREETRERLAQLKSKGVELPLGKYSCLIVDPPWQMQKIERDVRPNQVEFDYPTMTEDELKSFPLPQLSGDDCHLYLWTTQKHLPLALRLADHWGFKYQCLLTWRKNVGFTPFSWMYSTEHVLFCTKGSLPLLRMGVRLDFEAKVREHSRKPDEFYDIVREVSPGPRLDVFSREKRDGFDQYGNEVAKFE